MGTTANQKKLFFNLRKAKSRISALDEGDLRPDQVKLISKRLGVTEQDVVDMNRRLGGDVSLNAPIREDDDLGEWQDWLVDETASQEEILVASEEVEDRRNALTELLSVLNSRERHIFEARRLAEEPIKLEKLASQGIRRLARTGEADRGARLREGAAGSQEPRLRQGATADHSLIRNIRPAIGQQAEPFLGGNEPSDSPLTWDVDGQVLDPRLLNWLRIELHELHYLKRHTHFDGEAQRARFTGGKRVIMRPMSACKLRRQRLRCRLLHPWRQQLYCPLLDLGESLLPHISENQREVEDALNGL